MQTLKICAAASVLCVASAAFAQSQVASAQDPTAAPTAGTLNASPLTTTKDNYPGSFLDRPLVLPNMMVKPMVEFGVANVAGAGMGASSTTATTLSVGFDIGLMDRFQVGAGVGLPLSPNADFGYFDFNGQVGITPFLNARVDFGATKGGVSENSIGAPSGATVNTGFHFGVGAPIKYHLTPMLAVTSGNTPFTITGDNIISIDRQGGATVGLLNIPVGLMAQVHDMVGLQLRTGWAYSFGDVTTNQKFVPIAFDAMVNAVKNFDVGFTFALPGNTDAYTDARLFNFWVAARI
jgi:hypothetical protein